MKEERKGGNEGREEGKSRKVKEGRRKGKGRKETKDGGKGSEGWKGREWRTEGRKIKEGEGR